jgi:hypothetical protein
VGRAMNRYTERERNLNFLDILKNYHQQFVKNNFITA